MCLKEGVVSGVQSRGGGQRQQGEENEDMAWRTVCFLKTVPSAGCVILDR